MWTLLLSICLTGLKRFDRLRCSATGSRSQPTCTGLVHRGHESHCTAGDDRSKRHSVTFASLAPNRIPRPAASNVDIAEDLRRRQWITFRRRFCRPPSRGLQHVLLRNTDRAVGLAGWLRYDTSPAHFGASHRKQLLYLSANRISIRCQLDDSLPAVEAFGLQDSAARKS